VACSLLQTKHRKKSQPLRSTPYEDPYPRRVLTRPPSKKRERSQPVQPSPPTRASAEGAAKKHARYDQTKPVLLKLLGDMGIAPSQA